MSLDEMAPLLASDSEVMQTEPGEYPVLPVSIKGPVRVQPVPCVQSTSFKVTLIAGADPLKILAADPRRANAIIACKGEFSFGPRPGALSASQVAGAPSWDGNVFGALPYHSAEELWVTPTTPLVAPAVLTLTVVTEMWAQ